MVLAATSQEELLQELKNRLPDVSASLDGEVHAICVAKCGQFHMMGYQREKALFTGAAIDSLGSQHSTMSVGQAWFHDAKPYHIAILERPASFRKVIEDTTRVPVS